MEDEQFVITTLSLSLVNTLNESPDSGKESQKNSQRTFVALCFLWLIIPTNKS